MKIFNNLLKKLTLFDKVLILLTVLVAVFLVYLFFRKSEFVTVTVKVGESNVRYEPWVFETGTRVWFSQLFNEDLKETDGLGRSMAEVVSVRSYDTQVSRKAVYLTLKLRAVYNRASNNYTFKGRPLLIGSTIKVNLDKLFVEGLVTQIEGVDDPRQKEKLVVETKIREDNPTYLGTSGTRKHIADALNVGDEIKDNQGNIIIKITGKRVEDAKQVISTSDGRVLLVTNPLMKDVYLTLEVQALKIGDHYFVFDDTPILIGIGIPINTTTLSVWPEVTSIKKLE